MLEIGKLYLNKNNKYYYDDILVIEDIFGSPTRLGDQYITFYYVRRPDRMFSAKVSSVIDSWEALDAHK